MLLKIYLRYICYGCVVKQKALSNEAFKTKQIPNSEGLQEVKH